MRNNQRRWRHGGKSVKIMAAWHGIMAKRRRRKISVQAGISIDNGAAWRHARSYNLASCRCVVTRGA